MNIQQEIADLKTKLAELEHKMQAQPQPLSPITIKLPNRVYSVGKYPVTVGEYNNFLIANQLEPRNKNPQFPVTNVSWHEAVAYCKWLSETTGATFRLPTEDEFEHFCGNHTKATPEIAVYGADKIASVGTKQPNNYGIYDVLGLVWEWQSSFYDSDSTRVLRGGSWYNGRDFARSTYRDWFNPDNRSNYVGFRVLCEDN